MQPFHKNSFSYENPLKKKFGSHFFRGITSSAGIYFMLDKQNSFLYIGKAKNLRNRITHYSQIKPGNCSDHILEMIDHVCSIQWYECSSEKEALTRESELLHALRPPFNIAGTEVIHYLFIGIRERNSNQLDFQLTSRCTIKSEGYRLFGCFKNRKKTKIGYTALLRLIYAANFEKDRFSYPAKIARVSPPWLYSIRFPESWKTALNRFLNGTHTELLHFIIQKLLENENIPHFMRHSIQEDIEVVRTFYDMGPKFNYELKKKNHLNNEFIDHSQMNELIAKEINLFDFFKSA